MMMISKRKFRTTDGCNPYVMWVKCFRSSKVNFFLPQLGSKNLINQLFMVEPIERATTIENIDTIHTKSMEIQTKSRGGREENYTFKRRRKELWDTKMHLQLIDEA